LTSKKNEASTICTGLLLDSLGEGRLSVEEFMQGIHELIAQPTVSSVVEYPAVPASVLRAQSGMRKLQRS
jgi:hypothetical protein